MYAIDIRNLTKDYGSGRKTCRCRRFEYEKRGMRKENVKIIYKSAA